ncbi:hypothetical protein K488DRAFT_42040, partial [Vararia minispora EC-137]
SHTESRKRRADEPLDEYSLAKRAKVVLEAPSDLSKSENYEALQEMPSERILDDCPVADEDIPPLPLLYRGFGLFIDIYNGNDNIPELKHIDHAGLEIAVYKFAASMAGFFRDDDARRVEGLRHLNSIFAARTTKAPQFTGIRAESLGRYRTDGNDRAPHDAAATVVKFQKELTGNDTLPEVEVTCSVAQLNVSAKKMGLLFNSWRVPCLGITVVGPQVTFYGVLSLGHRYRLVSLTPTLSCLGSDLETNRYKSLIRSFTAASVLNILISRDAANLLDHLPSPIEPDCLRLPAIHRLRKWHAPGPSADTTNTPSDNDYVEFHIMNKSSTQPTSLLYVAQMDNRAIIVRFTQTYSCDVHAFCATRGHAPNLLAYERLPGGWIGIAMEFVNNPTRLAAAFQAASPDKRQGWRVDLRALVQELHEEDLVLGDFRAANIVVDDQGRIMLVDFDWGGRDGRVAYPTWCLDPELTNGRLAKDLIIRKCDDVRVLEATLSSMP